LADDVLYLFDGSNLFHAGAFAERDAVVDLVASFVAREGARGVLVFDGAGVEREVGRLSVRFAAHADALLERLAAEGRSQATVHLVTSDTTVRITSGQEVRKRSSQGFLEDVARGGHAESGPSRVADRLDDDTRARLERLRRGLEPD
jgi:predicted RNA-binding protein with PIN domain